MSNYIKDNSVNCPGCDNSLWFLWLYGHIRSIPSKQRSEDLDSAKLEDGWHFSWADYPNYQPGAVAEGKGAE